MDGVFHQPFTISSEHAIAECVLRDCDDNTNVGDHTTTVVRVHYIKQFAGTVPACTYRLESLIDALHLLSVNRRRRHRPNVRVVFYESIEEVYGE